MATAEFLAQWRSGSGKLSLLAKIGLPRADGSQVDDLFAGMGEVPTAPDSSSGDPRRVWSDLVREMEPVRLPGGPFSTDLALCTGGLTLYPDRTVSFPADVGPALTVTLRETLATHLWINAKVTIYRYFHALGDFKHAQAVLSRAAVTAWSLDDKGLHVSLRQDTGWNRPLTLRIVGRNEFPRVPDSAVGLMLPINYGDGSGPGMRRPWPPYPPNHEFYRTLAAGTGRYGGAILTDSGRGGGATQNVNARVHVSGHPVVEVLNDYAGRGVWMNTEAGLALLMGTTGGMPTYCSPVVEFNGADGAGIKIPTTLRYAMLAMVPAEVITTTNQCDDGHNILNPSDGTYAFFDYTALKRNLHFTFATPKNVADGTVLIDFIVGYQSYQATDFQAIPPTAVPVSLPDSPLPTIVKTQFFGPGSGWPDPTGWSNPCKLTFGTSSPYGQVKVFFCGLVIYFRPAQEIVQSERLRSATDLQIGDRVSYGPTGPFTVPARTPAVTALQGSFVCTVPGYKDDALGTYTGTADAIVERAPDIMVHLLNNYGGVGLSDIERGDSTFGSFKVARALLQNRAHALSISETTDVLTPLLWLSSDTMSRLLISPYDNRFRLVPWQTDPEVDYPWTFSRWDVREPMGPLVEPTPLPDVVTGVRVAYEYDTIARQARSEVALGYDRSGAGEAYHNVRDANMEVISGKNDRLDFRSNTTPGGGMTTRLAVLTPAIYVPQSTQTPSSGNDYVEGLAQQIKAQMGWAEGVNPSSRYQVTWGTLITEGYNDRFEFIRDGVTYTATVAPGDYVSCEALALAVQTAVNTAAGFAPPATQRFQCTYSTTAGSFFIRIQNDGSIVWKIKSAAYTNAIMQESGWASIGFYHGAGDVTVDTIGFYGDDRSEGRFAITMLADSEFELLFRSGTYGSDSAVSVRHCAELLGFTASHDQIMGFDIAAYYLMPTGRTYHGDGPKNDRETAMALAAAVYGPRRELSLEARTINNTDTALALRDRICDLQREPRSVIEFSTMAAPDIERGNVFEFQADLDGLVKYPAAGSDGSWVGKKFVVTEVVHSLGPADLATTIRAVETSLITGIVAPVGAGVMFGNILWRIE